MTAVCPQCGCAPVGDDYQPDVQASDTATAPGKDPGTGKVVAGYRLEKRVGDGATSAVYKAITQNDATADAVAVKVLSNRESHDHDALERFSREARLARRIKHPNLVHVHASGIDDSSGAHYLVMDLVEGETLEAIIQREGRLPWRQAVEYVFQVAQAVDHLRRHGCVHRDIKPGNILIAQGVAKLTDLGFVKPVSEGPIADETLVMGTPSYMAPEQCVDARQATHAADVYALGATLFHAITGRLPFVGADAEAIMLSVQRDPPPSARSLVADLPKAVDQLIAWALEKRPERRPENAAAYARAMTMVLSNPDTRAWISRARLKHRRRALTIAAIALGAAALIAVGVWVFRT